MFVWIFFAVFCLLGIIVAILGAKSKSLSSTFVAESGGRLDFLSYIQNYGQISIITNGNPYKIDRGWVDLLLQSLALTVVLGTLHLVEVLTLLVRDERIWRKATTRNGVQPESSTLLQAATNWQCWVLTAFKSIIPWIFSYGFICDTIIYFNLIPLCFLAFLFLMLALFAEALIRWEPKGSQPSTYGSIPALLTLVDEWNHKRLYWGQKGEVIDGVGKAGTSGTRLADVQQGLQYSGLRATIES
jgi:hypothetical protein